MVQNIYGVLTPPPEEHHKAINNLNTIVQGMNKQSYKLEGREHANIVLTIYNSAVMAQLAQMNVTINALKVQLKTLTSTTTNPTRSNRKFYCSICRRNFTHGSKTWLDKKTGLTEEAYYKKILGGSEKGRKWRLGEIIYKIKMINPKISLINCIGATPNVPSKNMPEIADSGVNIHLSTNPPQQWPQS